MKRASDASPPPLSMARRQLRRLLLGVLPKHAFDPLRFELHLVKVRAMSFRARGRFASARDLLVNVGSGAAGHEGWVNVDVYAYPNVTCVYDCRRQLPFADGSVRAIFSEHFFEHLDYAEEAPDFLAECRRTLAPGGVLRLVVPDMGAYLKAYVAEDWPALERLRGLEAGRFDRHLGLFYDTPLELVNSVFRQHGEHKWGYDEATMSKLLEHAGFRDVVRRAFGESSVPQLSIDEPSRASESLYFEATK